MSMYMTDFRKDLLSVLEENALINSGAELNSDDIDEFSDIDSERGSDSSNLDQDANDSDMETSENDEEKENLGQHEVKNKCGSMNTMSDVNDNDSDIEFNAPLKKCSKIESIKRSTKYTSISRRKVSIVHDQFELKRIIMDIKWEKVAIKKQKLEAEKQNKEYEFQLAKEKLQLEWMRIELQLCEKTQSSHNSYSLSDTASSHSWMISYNDSIGGDISEHDFTGSEV